MSCVFVVDLSDLRISQGVPMSDPLLTAGRPKNCLPYPCPCLEVSLPLSCCFISCVNIIVVVDQVASPWDRAVARARFGTPPPEGEETEMDIEAAWVVARSRSLVCGPVVGSGRRCAQDGRDRPCRRVVPGAHGGDDDDGDDPMPGDESDDVHGRVVGSVCVLLGMLDECCDDDGDESVPPPTKIRRGQCDDDRERGVIPMVNGRYGPSDRDNVHGCVRDFITTLGEKSTVTGIYETDNLPRSGSRVALCHESGCNVPYPHFADRGGLYRRLGGPVRDAVKRGVLFASNACSRTCVGCGVTHSQRERLYLCLGCHALTPYIRCGSTTDDGDEILETAFAQTAAYCHFACQMSDWPEHSQFCPRDDVVLHRLACVSHSVGVHPFGRLLPNGSRLPFLSKSNVSHPSALHGWGYT